MKKDKEEAINSILKRLDLESLGFERGLMNRRKKGGVDFTMNMNKDSITESLKHYFKPLNQEPRRNHE